MEGLEPAKTNPKLFRGEKQLTDQRNQTDERTGITETPSPIF
jgi:hypothetical protein